MATPAQEIHDLFKRYCDTWTAGDAEGFGQCFTDDADYVSYDGSWATHRTALQDNHDRLFRGVIAGSAMVGDIESIRFVTPDVAVLVGSGSVLMPWRKQLPKRRRSRQIMVIVNEAGRWRIAAIQNGRVRPVSIPAPDSMPAKMSHALTRAAQAFGIGRARAVTLP